MALTTADRVRELLARPAPLPIVQAGDPVLRRRAEPLTDQLDAGLLAELIAAMRVTMHAAPGVGLAAPQIGLSLAIAVVEDSGTPDQAAADARQRTPLPFRVLVNPSYQPVGRDRVSFYEGCLSVHGWQAVRSRWHAVRLVCTDHRGEAVDEVLSGWPARIVQHETDHLAGTLYLDDAELRSLTSDDNLARHWADPTPADAARHLGFALP